MGIIHHVRAMPDHQHQPRHTLDQRHGAQHRFGRVDLCGRGERGFGARRGVLRRSPERQAQRPAQQLTGIDRPHRLDEGKGRYGGELEASPGPLGPGPEARRLVRGRIRRPARTAPQPGIQQHRQAVLLHRGCEAAMRCAQAEEAGESQRPDVRMAGLERAAEHLGTDIDAECGLKHRPRVADGRCGGG